MSTAEDKQQARETGGAARRTYASLEACMGFSEYQTPNGDHVVAICPGAEVTRWRFVGSGKPTTKDASYERMAG